MFSNDLKFSDDHDDFVLESESYRTRTNLSIIFGITSEQQDNENTTLKYPPPKLTIKNDQNRQIEQSQSQQNHEKETQNDKKSSEWIIQIAKVVSAFKLINQENISQGKLGLTILKNSEELRKIILYKSKTNVLSTTTLNDGSKLYVKNSYLQFRDDLNEFWSVLFDQQNDSVVVLELIKDKIFKDTQELQQKPKTLLQTKPSYNIVQDNSEDEESNKDVRPVSDILSRMAKVGQPLPQMATIPSSVTTSTTTDQSDSSDNEIIASLSSSKTLIPLRKSKSTVINPQLVTFARHSQQTISPMPMMNTINTVSSYSTATPTNLLPSATDVNFMNMLMTENRTQNTEVRMNLTKLETKIEKVLDKINLLEKYGNNSRELSIDKPQKDDLLLELEEKLLEYKKENRKLKIKLEEYEKMIQQKEKNVNDNLKTICIDDFIEFKPLLDLMQIKIEDFETSEDLYKRIINQIQKELELLKQQLNDEKLKVKYHEDEIAKLKEKSDKQMKIIEEKSTLQLQKTEEMKSVINSLEKQNNELNAEKENLMTKLNMSTKEVEILKKTKEGLLVKIDENQKKSKEAIDLMIKEIMNNLYQVLVSRFEQRKTFTSEDILRICATSIKHETNNVIQRKS